uniref:Uncharacterized protein n=1 Tax=Acrobeloides nanus TaxID=290746 RepID=A0A914BUU1_9BILA
MYSKLFGKLHHQLVQFPCAWFYYDGMFIDDIIPQFLPLSILGLVFMLLEAMMNGILQATMIASIREALKKMLRIKSKPEDIAVTSYALQVHTTNNTDNGNNSLALTNNFIHGVI